jgi:hypothetical protein
MIMNQEAELQLILKLLYSAINTSSNNQNDKEKSKSFFTKFLSNVLRLSISKDLEAFTLDYLSESQVAFLLDSDFYENFQRDQKFEIPENDTSWSADDIERIFADPEIECNGGESKGLRMKFSDTKENIPVDQQQFIPTYEQDHVLFYGTQLYYVLVRMMFTFYERIIKTRELINLKVDEDIGSDHPFRPE